MCVSLPQYLMPRGRIVVASQVSTESGYELDGLSELLGRRSVFFTA